MLQECPYNFKIKKAACLTSLISKKPLILFMSNHFEMKYGLSVSINEARAWGLHGSWVTSKVFGNNNSTGAQQKFNV